MIFFKRTKFRKKWAKVGEINNKNEALDELVNPSRRHIKSPKATSFVSQFFFSVRFDSLQIF